MTAWGSEGAISIGVEDTQERVEENMDTLRIMILSLDVTVRHAIFQTRNVGVE